MEELKTHIFQIEDLPPPQLVEPFLFEMIPLFQSHIIGEMKNRKRYMSGTIIYLPNDERIYLHVDFPLFERMSEEEREKAEEKLNKHPGTMLGQILSFKDNYIFLFGQD